MVEQARFSGRTRVFTKSVDAFRQTLRCDATALELPHVERLSTHALRRGMARDIVDAGGSLVTLLRAGEWRSGAFAAYLREHRTEEAAVSQLVIDHSDSE